MEMNKKKDASLSEKNCESRALNRLKGIVLQLHKAKDWGSEEN